MITATTVTRLGLTATLLGMLTLAGCGKSGDAQVGASKGQIVAHVGNEVITTQELDNEFRLNNVAPDKQKDPETLKRLLGDLVARKYLVRQAIDAKLDREPGVLLDILRSRDLVLANAAISRAVAAKVSSISKADIDRYITSNPSKFARRQIMVVEQITFPLGANADTVVNAARDAKSLDEINEKLTMLGVPHGRSTGSLNTAELPENLVIQMQARKPDDVFFLRANPNGIFISVKSEEAKPLSGDAAINFARQALRSDLLKSEIGMVGVAANFEAKYEDDYVKVMGQPRQQPNTTE